MPEATRAPDDKHDAQLDELLRALYSMRDGDFSVRLDSRGEGRSGEIASVFNQVLDHCEQLSSELQRVGGVVSTEGRLNERIAVSPARGAWGKSVRSLNQLLDEVSEPVTSVAQILDAVAGGDLSQ
ncbi:hypothetical protein, partial [Nocardiopsis prasina]